MGRCGGWRIGVALLLAVVGASCGSTGEDPSDSGDPFVFETRGRLNLVVQPADDPRTLILQATLLDPQGVPFQNHSILFSAEFPDATFIPGNNNQGAVLTDNNGQTEITLVAGLTTGRMQVNTEAFNLNLAMGVTVELTEEGFVSLGPLGVIPAEVTFVNPSVDDMTIFNAVGGRPPYQWNNNNIDLGEIVPVGNINERAEYTLINPIPTEQTAALQDTITLLDAEGSQANALVSVVFAECALNASADTINFDGAVGGEEAQILITNGVPPFTVTQTFPGAGITVSIDDAGTVTVTVPTPPVPVDPNNPNVVLIRDSRGCTATVNVTVTIADLIVTPASAMLSPGQRQQFTVTGGIPPYQIIPSGGTVDTATVAESGNPFIYTAGSAEGDFTILVIDANGSTVEVPVSIQVATLQVVPESLLFCGSTIGNTARITILTGVPPFAATHTFSAAGTLQCEEPGGEIGDTVTCGGNSIIYLVTTNGSFMDSVIIQDSEGRSATVSVVINDVEECQLEE